MCLGAWQVEVSPSVEQPHKPSPFIIVKDRQSALNGDKNFVAGEFAGVHGYQGGVAMARVQSEKEGWIARVAHEKIREANCTAAINTYGSSH